jgi:hypothetical protein
MGGDLTSYPDRTLNLCQRLIVAENLLDSRIDPVAKSTLLRMARGTKRQRIDALGMVAALKLGQLDQIFGDDEEAISSAFGDFRESYDGGVSVVAAGPETPWLCAFVCALCVAAIADGVPGDEVPVCAVCFGMCFGTSLT